MLGVLPGPRPALAWSSVGSRCPATFDSRCLALFAGYPGLATAGPGRRTEAEVITVLQQTEIVFTVFEE